MADKVTKTTGKKAKSEKVSKKFQSDYKVLLEVSPKVKKVSQKKLSGDLFLQEAPRARKKTTTARPAKTTSKSATKAKSATKTALKSATVRASRARKSSDEGISPSPLEKEAPKGRSPFRINRKFSLLLLLVGAVALLILLGNKFLVVAWVDKKPITRWEYYQNMDKKYGSDIKEQMIVEKLITSEGSRRGVAVSATDVQNEIKKFEEEQGGADRLEQILQLQGLSRDDLNRLVKLQLLKQKMFGEGVNITDTEVNQYMDQNKDQLPDLSTADASAAAKLRSQVSDQLKQQKINQNFQTWLTQNMQSNRVIRN